MNKLIIFIDMFGKFLKLKENFNFIGAEKVVRHLHKHNIPIAIASGGAQDSFELKTTNHKEFVSMFSHVVLASTDPEVKNGKPAPDVFLICANRFPNSPKPEQVSV